MSEVFIGIDVGQSHHHVAVVDNRGWMTSHGVPASGCDAASIVALLRDLKPVCVAIDAPREPAPAGTMSRPCERDVQRTVGCRIFPTPSADRLAGHWGEGWTRAGFALFTALGALPDLQLAEVFPTASRTIWAGPRPADQPKSRWSDEICRRYAESLGMTSQLPTRWNQHQRDALTAAWTARLIGMNDAIELTGNAPVPGIWVPATSLHDRP